MKNFIIKYTVPIFVLTFSIAKSQVKITSLMAANSAPDTSAVLEISDNNKGLLLPRVPLLTNTDQVTVPTPVNGLTLYNSSTNKLNFWENSQWNKIFETSDALPYISKISNYSSSSTAPVVITGFPTNMTLFNLNSDPTGWTDLNVNVSLTPTNGSNSIFVSGEGMVQLNNVNNSNSFQYAISIFVDNQLKIVRKYKFEDVTACPWKKFEISGLFFDLTPNVPHNIKIYGFNLPIKTTGSGYGTALTYGGNATGCSNLNQDVARIYLTAQLTE